MPPPPSTVGKCSQWTKHTSQESGDLGLGPALRREMIILHFQIQCVFSPWGPGETCHKHLTEELGHPKVLDT